MNDRAEALRRALAHVDYQARKAREWLASDPGWDYERGERKKREAECIAWLGDL